MASPALLPFSYQRVVNAFERVQERLHRVAAALEAGGVPYAVVGGNAVASWVSRVDETLARATRDVDVLLRREDLARARAVLEDGGFIYRHVAGIDVFLDGPQTKVGDGVHILFATERVRPTDAIAAPDVGDSEEAGRYRVVSLEALVRLKLNAWRRKDQVHLQDLMSVGLIDETWRSRLPPVLGERLQTLLDDPDG